MRVVVFDIETSNWMSDTGSSNPADLSIAVVGVHDTESDSYKCFEEKEFPKLWKIIEQADFLVGYNSDHFDIPLLNKYYPGDLTRVKSIDVMKEIYLSLGRRVKLDAVAEGTLGENKLAGGGGQALLWWRAGEYEKVRIYCLKDVELTKRIFEYALRNNSVKYRELGKTHEVKLDTSGWLTPNGSMLTHTLGF